jgi:cholesterol oxidase
MAEQFDFDYIVIGSGFGGSVSALRLAEKGYTVAVLEMGKRFEPEDFPKSTWNLKKFLWFPKLLCHGFQQITLLKDVLIFHGAGVGGGSLVYANTLPMPPDEVFSDARWPTDEDWKVKLAPHYEMAYFMLGSTEAKEMFNSDYLLQEICEERGRGETFKKHQVAVHFGTPNEVGPDPFFDGEGPERIGCSLCGGCMTGCNDGGKNTLDKNYLYLAEKRGCVIHPETKVVDIRPLEGGGYEIDTVQATSVFNKRPKTLRARGIVLSASVLGTVKLLFECKERGSLPKISDALGDYCRTNSEALLGVTATSYEEDYSRGIAITSGGWPDEHTHIELVRYGKGGDFMGMNLTHLTGGGPPWPRWLRWLGNFVRHPVRAFKGNYPFGWAVRSAIVLVMQPLDNKMRLVRRWRPWGRVLTTQLDAEKRAPTYIPIANAVTEELAAKMNGTPESMLLEVLGNRSSTAHILGGATMGRDAGDGVCDASGRVFGYDNFFIADGSLVPTNLGVNPALTITALSEHVMAGIPDKPDGKCKPAPRPPKGN